MRPKSKTKSKPRKRFPSFKVSLLLIVLATFGGLMWLRNEVYTPYQHEAAKKIITIEPGANTSAIIARLYDEGILQHEWPTRIWLRLFPNNRRFKAGDYEFKSPISPREVLN